MNSFLLLLILELLAGVNAVVVFNFLDKPIAGLIAGSIFNLVGMGCLWTFYKQAKRWRMLSLAVILIFLFGFSLPLLVARASSPLNEPIESVFDIPIQAFHHGSEGMFMLMIVFTFAQWIFSRNKITEN